MCTEVDSSWVTSAICLFCPVAGTGARVCRGERQLPAEQRSDLPRWSARYQGSRPVDQGTRAIISSGRRPDCGLGRLSRRVVRCHDLSDGQCTELDDLSLGNADVPCGIQVGVDWFGPTDFGRMDEQFVESGLGVPDHGEAHSPESRFMGSKITEIPDQVQRANPLNYVHDGAPRC